MMTHQTPKNLKKGQPIYTRPFQWQLDRIYILKIKAWRNHKKCKKRNRSEKWKKLYFKLDDKYLSFVDKLLNISRKMNKKTK